MQQSLPSSIATTTKSESGCKVDTNDTDDDDDDDDAPLSKPAARTRCSPLGA